MNLKDKPDITPETIKQMENFSWFTHALIMDDLLIVAQKETACFVWKTDAGLVVIDGIWPDQSVYEAIISAIKDVGWDPDTICKFVITHGHVDHTGCGKWLVQNHHAVTYLSRADDLFWQQHPAKPDRPDTWKDFDIDCYIGEGDVINCGSKTLFVYSTPGHTPGCLSFLFPVMEHGMQHIAALFGGATPPRGDEIGKEQYAASIDHFLRVAKEKGADVPLSNHTAFDNGLERIAYSAKRRSYMPNIYILGQDGFERYCEVYKTLAR